MVSLGLDMLTVAKQKRAWNERMLTREINKVWGEAYEFGEGGTHEKNPWEAFESVIANTAC